MTTTTPKPFCFVLMPFAEEFRDVYLLGIKEAAEAAGAYSERVDEQIFHERILDRIYNQISKADIVVADMSGRSANVFYEVGYAHALGKSTILLTREAEDIPFDLKHFPHIVYGGSIAALRDELSKRIRWFVENPRASAAAKKFPIELWHARRPLSAGDVSHTCKDKHYSELFVTIENCSSQILDERFFRLAIVTPGFLGTVGASAQVARLPDGRLLHVLPPLASLFPGEYRAIPLMPQWQADDAPAGDITLIFRVLTEAESRDFPLPLRPPVRN